jgi:hypothetical protein
MPAGAIFFWWIVKETRTKDLGLSELAAEFSGSGSNDSLDFGYIPHVYSDETPETISLSIWFNLAAATGTDVKDLIQFNIDPGGVGVFLRNLGTTPVIYVESNIFNTQTGHWTASLTPAINSWHHVVMTFDISSLTNDPVIYYDGSSKTVTETITPSGTKYTKVGVPLIIGNQKAFWDYTTAMDGKLFDGRVYHRILSASEVTAIYNSGTPSVDAGPQDMVFQGPFVPTERLSDYIDATLSSDTKVRDAIYGAAGTPRGTVIGRSAP